MRLLRIAAPATAAVLAAGGVAAAAAGDHSPKTQSAAATFNAAPTSKSKTRTCTGSDGSYNETRGVYSGTSTGDPRLTGNIVIRTRTLVNTTTGLGTTTGRVFLNSNGRRTAVAGLQAVNTQSGRLQGFVAGKVRDTSSGKTGLYANFSAAFNSDGTALTGELGGNAPATDSAVFQRGSCDSHSTSHPHRGARSHGRGHKH